MQALSGLRFLAIAYVVWFHLLSNDEKFSERAWVVQRLLLHTNSVMPLFFLLSGFVLTYTYGERFESGSLTRRDFWISRWLRIWPIYLVALGLRFAVEVWQSGGASRDHVAGAIAQALLVQGWIPPYVWLGNSPGWTVSVEAFLYLLFPWLVVRLSRLRLSHGFAIALVLWFLGQLLAYAYVRVRPDGWPPQAAPGSPEPFYLDLLRYLPPLHLPSFVLGIVCARFLAADRAAGRQRNGTLLTLLGAVPLAICLTGGLEWLTAHGLPFLRWSFPFTHNGLLAPLWALLVLGLCHRGLPARLLSLPWLVRCGEASYGLYILHHPIYDAMVTWIDGDWPEAPLYVLEAYAILVPIAVLSFERFEQPLRTWLLWRLRRASIRWRFA